MKKKKLQLPSLEIIKTKYIYNKNGYLVWNINIVNNRIKKGDKVKGTLQKSRNLIYKYIGINGKQYAEHRIIWYLLKNINPDDLDIDHINRDTLDNRIENLRLVTTQQNNKNKNKYVNNTTGHPGIYKEANGRYAAVVYLDGKTYRNKTYETIEEALIGQENKKNELHK